jgi:hypothetical protein
MTNTRLQDRRRVPWRESIANVCSVGALGPVTNLRPELQLRRPPHAAPAVDAIWQWASLARYQGLWRVGRALPTPLNLADFRLPDSRPIRQLLLSPPVCAALLDQGIDQPILELQSTEVNDAGWSFLLRLSLDIRKEIVEIALGLTSSHATNDMAFKPYPQVVC